MQSGTKQYFDKVKKEVINIKKYATEKELGYINLTLFEPKFHKACIYGQMTGSCFSERATELIKKCCKTKTSFNSLEDKEPMKVPPRECATNSSFSFLEHCIVNHGKYNTMIIQYLKGESEILNFEL